MEWRIKSRYEEPWLTQLCSLLDAHALGLLCSGILWAHIRGSWLHQKHIGFHYGTRIEKVFPPKVWWHRPWFLNWLLIPSSRFSTNGRTFTLASDDLPVVAIVRIGATSAPIEQCVCLVWAELAVDKNICSCIFSNVGGLWLLQQLCCVAYIYKH